MSGIVIFKELTSEEYLIELESKAKEYEGLYVDMDNAPERKFVKEKASEINDLLKKIDRKRIDESRNYKNKVEAEAAAIADRLKAANAPFTLLLDEHKKKRAEILAAEKAAREAIELAAQIESDHADAIIFDKAFTLERAELLRQQEIETERLKEEAIKQQKAAAEYAAKIAEQKRIDDLAAAEQKRIADIQKAKDDAERERAEAEEKKAKDEADRLANIEHVTAICKAAKESLMQSAELTEQQAIAAVKAIRSGKVAYTTLNI